MSWLDSSLSDEDVARYLMQLVQTLKFEPHLDSPLARMLLRRALLNRYVCVNLCDVKTF